MSEKVPGTAVDQSSNKGAVQQPNSTWRDVLKFLAVLDAFHAIFVIVVLIPVAVIVWCFGTFLR